MMVVEKKSTNFNKSYKVLAINKFFIFSSVLLLLGILAGTLSVGYINGGYEDMVLRTFDSFISLRQESNFLELFFISFFKEFCIISVVLFSSFGVIGIPVVPLMLVFRGFTSGVLSGVLYRYYSLHGIAFSNLILLPSDLICFFAIIYLSSKCFELSLKFFSLLRDVSSKGVVLRPSCVIAARKFLLCVVAVVVSALVQAILTVGFIRFFNFT